MTVGTESFSGNRTYINDVSKDGQVLTSSPHVQYIFYFHFIPYELGEPFFQPANSFVKVARFVLFSHQMSVSLGLCQNENY